MIKINSSILLSLSGRILMSIGFLILLPIIKVKSSVDPRPSLNRLEEIIQAPGVGSFMKYGNYAQNLYTGTAMASIPIYTYKDNDFVIPVSLSYASNGLMVNMPANSVGLGWFLNAGGMITRQIIDVPDEFDNDGTSPFPRNGGSYWNYWGYYEYYKNAAKNSANIPIFSNPQITQVEKYFYKKEKTYCYRINSENVEMSPDIFSFNFMGHSGKFMMGPDTIYVFGTDSPHGEYRVNLSRFRYDDNNNYCSIIEITTGDGYMYTFGTDGPDAAKFFETYLTTYWQKEHDDAINKDGTNLMKAGCNLWLLTQITAPNGRKVSFSYNDAEVYHVVRNGVYDFGYSWDLDLYDGMVHRMDKGSSSVIADPTYLTRIISRVCQLNSINIDNKCTIKFDYSDRKWKEKGYYPERGSSNAHGLVDLPMTKKLDSITVISAWEPSGKPLKRAILDYYPCSRVDTASQVLLLRSLKVRGKEPEVYRMEYYCDNPSNFPVNGCTGDHWGYFNGRYTFNTVDMTHINDDRYTSPVNYVETVKEGCEPNAQGAMLGMLKRITYPTGGFSQYEYESHDAALVVKRTPLSNNFPGLMNYSNETFGNKVGGVRVSKIDDCTITGGDTTRTRRAYSYDCNGVSSGIVLKFPRHSTFLTFAHYETHNKTIHKSSEYHDIIYSSESLEIHTEDHSHIGYSEVTETYDDGSNIKYHFTNYSDIPDNTTVFRDRQMNKDERYLIWVIEDYVNINNSLRIAASMHLNRGKLSSKQTYDASGGLVEEQLFVYDKNAELPYSQRIYRANDIFSEARTYIGEFPLEKKLVRTRQGNQMVGQEIRYSYNNAGQIIAEEVLDNGGRGTLLKTQYIVDIPQSDRSDSHNHMVAKNYVQYPIREQRSEKLPGQQYLFVEGKYNDYVCYSSTNGPRLEYVKTTNITWPLEMPDFQFDGYLKTVGSFSYSPENNIWDVRGKSYFFTTYIWGYHHMYPVARIQNATRSQVMAALGHSQLTNIEYSLIFNETTHMEWIKSLKSKLPDCQITIYTHKPLIGVTSITDPSGRKTTYEYDDAGRLILVRDDKGNTLNKYEYHIQSCIE